LRDIEDLVAECGVEVSHETLRQWRMEFGPEYAQRNRKPRCPLGDRWFLDGVMVSIRGGCGHLWRAVDQDGDVLDILVQKRKNNQAAKSFFRMLPGAREQLPSDITTDKLPSYGGAKKEVMPSVAHCKHRYANNRAELSHDHTREKERQMRGFEPEGNAQRFPAVYGQVHNLFRVGRYLLRAMNYR